MGFAASDGVLDEGVAPLLPKENAPNGFAEGAAGAGAASAGFSALVASAAGFAAPKLNGLEVVLVCVAAGAPKEKPPNAGLGADAGGAEEGGAPKEKVDVDVDAGVLVDGGAPNVKGLLVGAAAGAPNENGEPDAGAAAAGAARAAPPRFGMPRILQTSWSERWVP